MKSPIYMDHSASTPVDPRVLEAMLPYFSERFGNAHSRAHSFGWLAEQAVDTARQQVAALLGCRESEILFTSGGTESCNLAVSGIGKLFADQGGHVVTTRVEHRAVLDPIRRLEQRGWAVTWLDVDRTGQIDLEQLRRSLREETRLVSVLWANNEIGTLLPVNEIGAICAERDVLLHVDACQGLDCVPLDVQEAGVHLLSLSGHKLYGPKGIGALYVRRRAPRVRLAPLIVGGGQERGLRAGTLNVPGIVGLGEALRLCVDQRADDAARLHRLRRRLKDGLSERLGYLSFHGDPHSCLPGLLSVSVRYVEGEALMMSMRSVALASGSACTSATLEPSHVLRALGLDEDDTHSAVRFSLGRYTSEEEVDRAIDECVAAAKQLRAMSPLWELAMRGTPGDDT